MPQYWYIVEALVALARNRRDGRRTFTRRDLRNWSDKIGARPRSAYIALDHLEAYGLVRRITGEPDAKPGDWQYAMTPEGRAAAIAAEETRCRTDEALTRLRDSHSLESKVYLLLRARRSLTGPDAAATLCDAGDDTRSVARRAAACMKAWAEQFPHSVQAAAQRADGAVRYVFLEEIKPRVQQRVTVNKRAQGGATA